jgi:hypothetical protein
VQQLGIIEELKQQMLQRQQQAESLAAELKVTRGERCAALRLTPYLRNVYQGQCRLECARASGGDFGAAQGESFQIESENVL